MIPRRPVPVSIGALIPQRPDLPSLALTRSNSALKHKADSCARPSTQSQSQSQSLSVTGTQVSRDPYR